MKLLASPAGVAVCALLLAASVFPPIGVAQWETGGTAIVALLAMLVTVAAILRGLVDRQAAVVALGMSLMVAAAGHDALRGHDGLLVLRPGQGRQAFEERGPAGTRLGLRPLGTAVSLETVVGNSASLLIGEGPSARRETLAPDGAVGVGDYRLGWARRIPHARLAVGVTRGNTSQTVEVSEDMPARAGDLEIELDRYFPDFALDARNQAYTRSDEPRNPGALLRVQRGGASWRVLILRNLPDIHRIPDLDATFAMRGLADEPELEIAVRREPAALLAAAGAALAALGLLIGGPRHLPRLGPSLESALAVVAAFVVFLLLNGLANVTPAAFVLAAAAAVGAAAMGEWLWSRQLPGDRNLAASAIAALAAVLLVASAEGSILEWRLAAASREMPGVGIVAGLLLLTCIGAAVVLAAERLCPGASAFAAVFGRRALVLGGGLGVIATGLLVKEALTSDAARWAPLAAAGAVIAGGTALLVVGARALMAEPRTEDRAADANGPLRLVALAAALAALGLLAAGLAAWQRQGSYAAGPAQHALVAALAGVAAVQPTSFPMLRIALFVAALASAFLAQL